MNVEKYKHATGIILCTIVLAFFISLDFFITSFTNDLKKAKTPPFLGYIPQFVLISFDGSRSVEMWQKIAKFEEELNREKKIINFTYFINSIYFLTSDRRDLYQAPRRPRGESNVGFSEGMDSLRQRILEVNKAIERGDEIASHAAGHFWGGEWSEEEWQQEFRSFNNLLFGIDFHYPNNNFLHLNLKPQDIVGFRAPALSVNANMYTVLNKNNFIYDSSEIGKPDEWPHKDEHGLWHIPLGIVYLNNGMVPVVAMDYSIKMHETGNIVQMKRDTDESRKVYEDILSSYFHYFDKNYNGNRAPVLIGYHFESWDDDLYFEVMKEFVLKVCSKPEVRCTTFKNLVNYMNDYGLPKLVKK